MTGGTGGRFAFLADEDYMEEESGGELEDCADREGKLTDKEDNLRPGDRMDYFPLYRVRNRKGTTRAVATLRANYSNMGLPEEVDLVDVEGENKRGKKRRTRQEPPADDLAKSLTSEYMTKPGILSVYEEDLMAKHRYSALGVQKGLEEVLLHRRQHGEPSRTPPPSGDAEKKRYSMNPNDSDVILQKGAEE